MRIDDPHYEHQGYYTTAAVCLRGHVATADAESHPVAVNKFCSVCGADIIKNCPHCGASIHGHYVPPGVSAIGSHFGQPPSFCSSCGKQFPWTAAKVSAARELADELEGLSADERSRLKIAIDDVSTNGPRAEVGAARIKKMVGKATSAVGQALWRISVEVASEAAKKILTGA